MHKKISFLLVFLIFLTSNSNFIESRKLNAEFNGYLMKKLSYFINNKENEDGKLKFLLEFAIIIELYQTLFRS